MFKMRPYKPDDLHKVLQFIGYCFRARNFSDYHPGDILHAMSSRYHGDNLDHYFWLFEQEGKLIAFAELFRAKSAMYTLIVHPDCDYDVELRLFAECQRTMAERMKNNPADKCVLSTNISDSDEQTLACLRALGYDLKSGGYVQGIRSLGTSIPVPVVPEGFYIRCVKDGKEAHLLAEVHKAVFGKNWTAEKYLKVMQTPGFSIENELVVIAPDGRFAAFLVYWLDSVSKSGLFEPVGCHKDFRRQGLTKALMYEAMQRMVNADMEKAVVLYESDNPASTHLYTSVGFIEGFKTLDCEITLGTE